MSNLCKIINQYEEARKENYFKLGQKKAGSYGFRILNPKELIYGYEVWVETGKTNPKGEPELKPKRFFSEHKNAAKSWVTADYEMRFKEFLAMHIYSIEDEDCFIFFVTQRTLLNVIMAVAKMVGEDDLQGVLFRVTKTGEGKESRYSLMYNCSQKGAEPDLYPLPAKACEIAKLNPVNMLALMFGDRPWDNDKVYDIATLDQSYHPDHQPVIESTEKNAKVISKKRVALVHEVAHA